MRIPDEVRKTVGFIGFENQVNKEFVPVGSMFFFGHDPKDGGNTSPKMYAVTALHNIDKLKKKGATHTVLRLNSKTEGQQFVEIAIPIDDWFLHPSDRAIDVAVKEMGIPDAADHLCIPFSMAATKTRFAEHEVYLGDEVFVSGLFSRHYGKKRNIPIIRVGHLAALDEEKVATEYGEIDGYLIEARSIGGLSGSPAFLNLGIIRKIGGQVRHATGDGSIICLLGLIHGHFDVNSGAAESGSDEAVNSGIAIVVPVESIRSVIDAYEKPP